MSTETEYWLSVAKALFASNQSVFREAWSVETLAMWLRESGKCAYCKLHLLQNRQTTYGLGSIDHLLPTHEYPALEYNLTNWVLSCRCCNGMKRRWDPNRDGQLSDGASSLSDEQREKLIARVLTHLDGLRADRDANFLRECELIMHAINRQSRSASAR